MGRHRSEPESALTAEPPEGLPEDSIPGPSAADPRHLLEPRYTEEVQSNPDGPTGAGTSADSRTQIREGHGVSGAGPCRRRLEDRVPEVPWWPTERGPAEELGATTSYVPSPGRDGRSGHSPPRSRACPGADDEPAVGTLIGPRCRRRQARRACHARTGQRHHPVRLPRQPAPDPRRLRSCPVVAGR
jgi:hypothetical protein